jgi:putative FmdB family regulatory protein
VPTYQYACTECGHQLEAVQTFSDSPLTVCPDCQGRLRKVFSSVGVVFKGSGFYRTDSRAASNGSSAPKTSESTNGKSSTDTSSSGSNGSSAPSGSATKSSNGTPVQTGAAKASA